MIEVGYVGGYADEGCYNQYGTCLEELGQCLGTPCFLEVGSHKEKDDEEEVIGHLHVVRGDLQGHEQGGEDASPQQFPTIGEHNACYGGWHVGKGDELPDVSGGYQDEEIGRECPHDTAQSGQPDRYAEDAQQDVEAEHQHECEAHIVGQEELVGFLYPLQ